jgi:hypothetical protein
MNRLILIVLILSSCSPIKRHSRLVRKYPFVHTTDSVKLIDTVKIRTESVRVDTVIGIQALNDGVVVSKGNLNMTAQIIRDSFYLDGECDTIVITKIIERNIPVKYYETKGFTWNIVGLIWLISFLVFLFFWFFEKRK